jgi:Cellulose synthase subunit D
MTDLNDTALAYYADRQVAPQWRGFLAALSGELFENIPADQAAGFLRQVGKRMAASQPLPAVETLEALQDEANKALAALDWGFTRLEAGAEVVAITHAAFPSRIDAEAEHWPRAFAAVAEGLYSGWMAAQGAGASLAARAVQSDEPGVLRLTFGALAPKAA